jgi:hypothetical protein
VFLRVGVSSCGSSFYERSGDGNPCRSTFSSVADFGARVFMEVSPKSAKFKKLRRHLDDIARLFYLRVRLFRVVLIRFI